ncbi:MAG TPA: fumarylacetoacetate hydrolase family protein [bacterium]|nr:fumarylacetoacetate hydrolase family protein [bacterium]
MKYVRVVAEGLNAGGDYGILEGEFINIIEGSPLNGNVAKTGKKISAGDVKIFLPPVEAPSIIALGLNYLLHAKENNLPPPPAPVIFIKAVTALTGHLEPIFLPKEAPDFVDYEAELVIVIGKKAKHVSVRDAKKYILGYTCGNDVSARDCQMKLDKQWARGKSFDTFAPIGPCLVTDIDAGNLKIQTRLNDRVMQESNTSDLIFGIPEIVSYLSRQMTLLPGTVIMTGTPSGVGFARNPQVFLRQGDTVEIEIEGIGTLKNRVELEK